MLSADDTRGQSPGGVGGGGTLNFSNIRRLGLFFGVQNFEFQYLGVFRKNKYFLRRKILWIFFGTRAYV